ncbi:MAG: hypothetical protein WBB29_19430, partial [Geitlerinemataceae cyanobacterium]
MVKGFWVGLKGIQILEGFGRSEFEVSQSDLRELSLTEWWGRSSDGFSLNGGYPVEHQNSCHPLRLKLRSAGFYPNLLRMG